MVSRMMCQQSKCLSPSGLMWYFLRKETSDHHWCQFSLSPQYSDDLGFFPFFPFYSVPLTITQSISGCFSRMCCAIDPSVPYDFPHQVTWQINFLSISLAHLRTLLFLSSVSSLEKSQKDAMRSASSFFSSRARRSCKLRLLLVVVNLPIYAAQKLMACSMLPSKELMETSSSGGERLLERDYQLIIPGIMMTLLLVPYFNEALLIVIIQLFGRPGRLQEIHLANQLQMTF